MADKQFFKTIESTVNEKKQVYDDQLLEEFRDEYREAYQKNILPDRKILKQLQDLPSFDCLDIPSNPTVRRLTLGELSGVEIGEAENASAFLNISEEICSQWIDEDLKNEGLAILQLSEMDQIPQEIREKFLKSISNSKIDRIASAAGMLANHTFLIHLSDSVIPKKQITVQINPTGKTNFFPLIIWIYIGRDSSVNLHIKSSSKNTGPSSYLMPIEVRTIVEEGGSVEFFEIQNLDENWISLPYHEYYLSERARLESFVCESGAIFSKRTVIANLEGTESEAILTCVYKPAGRQKLIFDTIQNHRASYSRSNLEYKGVLGGESETLWKGNIYVEKGTKGVDGYQRNENILLGANAHAESIPGLEIIADDVKCSHGVTLSRIDHNQLFYMKSRGIPEEDAVDLISNGFLQSATIRIHNRQFKKSAEDCLIINNK